MDSTDTVICKDDWAIVQKHDFMKLIQLKLGSILSIAKLRFAPENAFGQQWGSVFEVRGQQQLELVATTAAGSAAMSSSNGDAMERDNRHIVDQAQASQKLSGEDIASLKAEAGSGERLVNALIDGNETFSQKTALAQRKYVDRKSRKHFERLALMKPTPRLICRVYYERDATRIDGLRPDSLSFILSYLNVQSGLRFLVYDGALGITTGAILYRLGGAGQCVLLHRGPVPQGVLGLDAILTDRLRETLLNVPLGTIFDIEETDPVMISRKRKLNEAGSTSIEPGMDKFADSRDLVLRGGFDGLAIVSPRHDPVPLLTRLLDLLSPGRPFILCSSRLEPLRACFAMLQKREDVIDVLLQSNAYRAYQAKPGAMHPEMAQNVTDAHLLYGVKVS